MNNKSIFQLIKVLLLIIVISFSACILIPAEPPPSVDHTSTANSIIPTYTTMATETPAATKTPVPLILQPGVPAYIRNFSHPVKGCDWMGIAGQVFGADRKPQVNRVVIVKGKLSGSSIDQVVLTGVPEGIIYGPGGYEITLADRPVESVNSITIQVFDLENNPLSLPVNIDTFAECDKNLIIVNFISR